MNSWIFLLVLLQLAVVSWIDVKTKKISNLWFPLNLVLSIGLHFLFPEAYPWVWATLLFPIGWIILGFILFIFGVMGAGDSKYLASLFLIIPVEQQVVMIEKIVISTVVVGATMLSLKILKDFKKNRAYALSSYWLGLRDSIRSHFSYAPVILLGWILVGLEQWN